LQVRNAVGKERQSLDKEKERIKRAVHDEKEKRERIIKQMTEELDIEKERHSQTRETLNKLKQVCKVTMNCSMN
jgi:vacuolar-type H+-ATPase subunit I/STV1